MRRSGTTSRARRASGAPCAKCWSNDMAERVVKLPDIGEGIAEAELVEWHVKVGDAVREDTILGAVMTDKATVEVPSPAEGEIVWLAGKVGDVVAVGADFVRMKVPGGAADAIPEQPASDQP